MVSGIAEGFGGCFGAVGRNIHHMLNKNKKKKLKSWILLAVISIILVQACASIGTILLTGTPEKLDMSSIKSFTNTVMTRGDIIEQQMVNWKKVEDFQNKYQTLLFAETYKTRDTISSYVGNSDKRKKLLNNIMPTALRMLRNRGTTSCILLLDREDSAVEKDALILRDINPHENADNNSDILVEAGSSKLMFDKGLTLDSFWSEHFTVTEDMDFFYKPYNAGNTYSEMSALELGYFSPTTVFHENDISQICYTIPLLDENHHSYGVLGFAVSIDYINKNLPGMELGENSSYSYCMGILNEEEQEVKIVTTQNAAFRAALPINSTVDLLQKDDQLFFIDKIKIDGEVCANIYRLHLYETNTPFVRDQWVVIGIAKKDALYGASHRLIKALVISIFVSLVAAFLLAIVWMYWMIHPIHIMMKGIEASKKQIIDSLPQTNIFEFDELASTIIESNKMVYKMGSRLTDIIDLANIPLGVIEYNLKSNVAFCNKQVMDMLQIELKTWNNNYVSRLELKEVLEGTNTQYTRIEPQVFRRDVEGQPSRWYRVSHAKTDESTILIIMDITSDMQKQMKIRHDRDYDVLTNIYNRRAFIKHAKKLIDQKQCNNGILVMWDLDHLKYVNDTYGHSVGDMYIKSMGDILRNISCENHISARLSGDEFVLFLYDEEEDKLLEIANSVHEQILKTVISLPDEKTIELCASGGLARYSQDATNYIELLQYADYAMYEVKHKEKGRLNQFDKNTYVERI